jgi:periplasmic protein TonB
MNGALIYRPNNRRLTWFAFACAITVHLTAIAIAGNKAKPVSVTLWGEPQGPVEGIDPPPPTDVEIILPPDQPIVENPEFVDANITRPPIHPRMKTPVVAVPRAIGMGTARTMGFGSAKALTLYAPKPNYPYEARRGGVTGSGIAELVVNPESGIVIDARMSQSTGSEILDNATVETLRRWKLRPGVASNIAVPITYTLTGVSY